jgi:DNA-binding PadR family transcriptional regulator
LTSKFPENHNFIEGFNFSHDEVLVKQASKVPADSITAKNSYLNLKNIQKKTLDLFILRLLEKKAHYGYEIKQAIKEHFNLSTSRISAYKTLYKLHNEGFVTCKIIQPFDKEQKHPRKYYFITPSGMKLLIEAKKFFKNFYNMLFGRD